MIERLSQLTEPHWIEFYLSVAAVVVILWLLRKLSLISRNRFPLHRILRRVTPLADAMGLILLVFLLGKNLFNQQPHYQILFTIIVFVFLLWLVRSALMDVVSGIILRFENRFGSGDAIGLEEGSGTITHLGVRCLEIALDKGKQISVPYSRLSSKALVKPFLARRIKSETIEIWVPRLAGIDEAKSSLKREIMTQPWSIAALKPLIEPVDEHTDRFQFKVTIHALELDHLSEIKRALRAEYPSGK